MAASVPLLTSLSSRRLVFVVGKGGTGKTSVAGALALCAAREGRHVLLVDVDTKGDTARALGAQPGGFDPLRVASNISVVSLHLEDALQEYLSIYFKVPRFARLTPLSRIYGFIATSVPGPRDMLVVGKIAYEEKRTRQDGRPVWDQIIVDGAATGHSLPQLKAARTMLGIAKGGLIRGHIEWIERTLSDETRTAMVITSTPEEMAVQEARELVGRAPSEAGVHVAGVVLNRMPPSHISVDELEGLARMGSTGSRRREDVARETLLDGANFAVSLSQEAQAHRRRLRRGLGVPVTDVSLLMSAHTGLETTRGISHHLEGA